MRQFLRQHVPAPIRLQLAAARRRLDDATSGDHFAATRDTAEAYPHPLPDYALPISDYAGQAHVAAAKRQNLRLLPETLDATVVQPGEVWSLWRLAGRPTHARGYGDAAAIVDGELTTAVGGSTCLLSTVVFNAGLQAGLDIVERTQHSVDTYGERRYFELGRDATIEYGYLDLRFRNELPWPLTLRVAIEDGEVRAGFLGPVERPFEVDVTVDVFSSDPEAIFAHTARHIRRGQIPVRTRTYQSRYRRDNLPARTPQLRRVGAA